MIQRRTTFLVAALLLLAPAAHADLASYSEDFESLDRSAPDALRNVGWRIMELQYAPYQQYLFEGGAPNSSTDYFCGIRTAGGVAQGDQALSVFSDYTNPAHNTGNQVEVDVFQRDATHAVSAGDVGSTWVFTFDANKGSFQAPSQAFAYIKTRAPLANNAMIRAFYFDITNLPAGWATHSISITIQSSDIGHVVECGFASMTSNHNPTEVSYDNVSFKKDVSVATERRTWGALKSRYR